MYHSTVCAAEVHNMVLHHTANTEISYSAYLQWYREYNPSYLKQSLYMPLKGQSESYYEHSCFLPKCNRKVRVHITLLPVDTPCTLEVVKIVLHPSTKRHSTYLLQSPLRTNPIASVQLLKGSIETSPKYNVVVGNRNFILHSSTDSACTYYISMNSAPLPIHPTQTSLQKVPGLFTPKSNFLQRVHNHKALHYND